MNTKKMQPLKRTHEETLAQQGFFAVAGVDEAGRGAFAGPLVAAAVIMPMDAEIPRVQDSKKIAEKVREVLYEEITTKARAWAVAILSEQVIDNGGVQKANLLALAQAVKNLTQAPDYVVIDGFALKLPYPSQKIIHGDRDVFPIACASIIAKVTRDRIMRALEQDYPAYRFATHKGYGTLQHRREIHEHGLSAIHRKSFRLNKWK
ncbi:MAG: ribonuclease HII [Patescibacteria group bacterium]